MSGGRWLCDSVSWETREGASGCRGQPRGEKVGREWRHLCEGVQGGDFRVDPQVLMGLRP